MPPNVDDFPTDFLSHEADFVENKMAINNCISDILRNGGMCIVNLVLVVLVMTKNNSFFCRVVHAVSNASQIAQANVVEAQRCMKLMTVEMRGRAPHLKKNMQTKINLYRDELQGLIRDLERAQLMAREENTMSSTANQKSQYERLIKNNDRLTKSSKKLEDTHRIVAETKEVGITVLNTLAQQRESLLGTHEKVRETGAMTTEARRILQRMTRRIITNTLVLYTIIFVLIAAICYVLYVDFIRATR
ncbi:hypothetical protein DD237_003034 [Peronospora effusa]|uniref:Vesicle transport v-SNARE N-terminal domain-containing protein n=1 Tax=Peronospora effusa TaxID=542832 RepID=A0A425CFQ9_9STRA|nr:hypothetical protein DD237_003034 [Peronospora effusa]